MHDVLRRVGDLTLDEARLRADDAEAWLEQLGAERRAVRLRVGGEPRWIAAEDAGLYRDALGSVPPSGLPEVFLEDVPDAMERLVRRYARTHGPFEASALKERYGLDLTPVLAALERAGELVRGELRPGGTRREWCDPEVLRRLRRASLAALRKEIEPADQRALARFMPSWQGVDRHPASGAGIDRLRDVLVPLQGIALPVDVWERDVLPRRVGAYSPSWLDQLCAAGELVWVGAGSLGRRSGKVAIYFREDAALLGAPPGTARARGRRARRAARPPGGRRLLLHRPADRRPRRADRGARRGAVGSRLGRRGDQRRVGAAALAEAHGRRAVVAEGARRAPPQLLRPPPRRRPDGAGPLVADRGPVRDATIRPARRRAQAELLLERYGIVTREQVLAEGIPGGFSSPL